MAVTGLVLAALAGCSSSDGNSESASTDAISSAWAPIPLAGKPPGAGTVLGNGFTVPKRAFLVDGPIALGVAVIYSGVPLVDAGWEAYLEVPGDPRPVMDEVRRQAEAAGLPLRPVANDLKDPVAFCGPKTGGYFCLAAAATA